MNDSDDKMKQDQEETKKKMEAASGKKDQKEDEDTGAHLSPERDIGSQRKATSSSRTPSNEM